MSLSSFAYASSPQQTKTEVPCVNQNERRLVEENESLKKDNTLLRTTVQDLEAGIDKTKKVAYALAAVVVVILGIFIGTVNSLRSANQQLSERVSSLELRASSFGEQADTKSATATTKVKTSSTTMVYIPASGRCYHDSYGCAGRSPTKVTLEEALARGYDWCSRCKPPR